MEKKVAKISSFEEMLEDKGYIIYTNKGYSMLPLLRQGKDLFTVTAKPEGRCHKYDAVLYHRGEHTHVLHRIIKVREHDYVILGDNCENKEYGITDDDIVGVMTGFVRNGVSYSTSDWRYVVYSHVWVWLHPLRIFLLRVFRRGKSWIRKLIKG